MLAAMKTVRKSSLPRTETKSFGHGPSTRAQKISQRPNYQTHLTSSDLAPASNEVLEVFRLVSLGVMPPVDGIREPDGAPSWTLESIAKILEISRDELIQALKAAGPRFKQ